MPADETSEPKALKVSESIARALNQLELVVDTFNNTTGRSVFEVLKDLAKPSRHRPDRALKQRLSIRHPEQKVEGCLSAVILVEQSSEGFFVLVHCGQLWGNCLDLSELISLIVSEIFFGFEQSIFAILHGGFCGFGCDAFWEVSWLAHKGISSPVKLLIDEFHHMKSVSDNFRIWHQPMHQAPVVSRKVNANFFYLG